MYPLALAFATVVFLTQHVLSARSSTDRHRLLLLRNIYVTYTYATWIAISAVRWAPMLAISTRFISFPLNLYHFALLFHNRSTSLSHFSSSLFIVFIIFLFLHNAFSLYFTLVCSNLIYHRPIKTFFDYRQQSNRRSSMERISRIANKVHEVR